MKKLFTLLLILALILPAIALAKNEDDPIVGKWSFYWDTRPLVKEYYDGEPFMDTLIQSLDFYFFSNNIAYATMSELDKDGKFKLHPELEEGVWVKSEEREYIASFNGNTFKIKFDSDGKLLFYIIPDLAYPFIKVPSFDFHP